MEDLLLRTEQLPRPYFVFSGAVRNFREFTDCTLKELAMVSSLNALNSMGIKDRGRISKVIAQIWYCSTKRLKFKKPF